MPEPRDGFAGGVDLIGEGGTGTLLGLREEWCRRGVRGGGRTWDGTQCRV